MFLTLSGAWALSWIRILKPALVGLGSGSGLFFASANSVRGTLSAAIFGRGILFLATSKTNDLILTYRLWVIFNKSIRVMAVPYFIWVGYLVAGIGLIANYIMFRKISREWFLCFISLSIAMNVYFTGSVLTKVRQVRKFTSYGGTNITKAMTIVIESAAIYTIWFFVLVVGSAVPNAGLLAGIFSEGAAPVAGIVTMLVNVRVGLGWAWDGSMGQQQQQPNLSDTVEEDIGQAVSSRQSSTE
ncbi:hypothetical protein P691DRAFT_772558 [Macrolepiota fuliginosa MF-IS2]|uniref:Uncharacterized protein n=1 Tax=Macrolepiota fuliginosa MF-IS2 TaxID=1400762 RepID=A0A9P5XKH0_9AGAR|nr:hypothetical protein P691DRAFT_772558 [Macrolepiota fuliginosa MF-IS2]